MAKKSGADMIVEALEEEAVPFAFGIPGAQNLELYDALDRSEGVRPVLVTDEQCASFMADGVSRSSGKLGCVNLVPGAGLTHALSGIAEAFMDQVPLLVLSCGVRSDIGKAYQLHDVPQLELARPVTKAQYRVTEGERIAEVLRKACRTARQAPQGPVIVEIPANLMVFHHEPARRETAEADAPAGQPLSDAITQTVARLQDARRPLLYLGNGCAEAPQADLVALAECLQAPVATTIQGKGVFPESHPLWLWCGFGAAAPKALRAVAGSCDATLAIGCRFAEVGTASYGVSPPRPLIHVDVDPEVLGRNYETDLPIRADAAVFVRDLLGRLSDRDRDEDLQASIAGGQESVAQEWLSWRSSKAVSGPRMVQAVQARFGPETIYVVDSGNGLFLAMESLRLNQPRSFLAPVDFSCMGYALPAAIGAGLANPDRPVAAFMGDGAFLMTGLELITAAQLRVSLALFVLRDRELTQIAQFQDTAFAHRCASDLPDFELRSLCAGLGVPFLSIQSDPELDDGIAEALNRSRAGPVVVEVAVDNTQRTFFTQGVVRTNFGRLPWGERLHFVTRALGRRAFGR
ncbi:MAG: thiamine pyrophosphate-binding protein [Kiloniellales bacterium]|nr:thiamine pyrophosphate-binding protein [Kiloniellales bacterium]